MDDVPSDLKPPSQAEKKPYELPQLETYGDMSSITQAVSMNTTADGAPHGNTKTA